MTKKQLEGSLKSFKRHLDPAKVKQLEWKNNELENKVEKILHLTKFISGKKDGNSSKQSKLVNLIEDVHQQYEWLYSLYEDLRVKVKNSVNGGDKSPSSSASDSESSYSTDDDGVFRNGNSAKRPTSDTADVEHTILKGKLTSSSGVKETPILRPQSRGVLKEQKVHDEESAMAQHCLAQVEGLKGEVARLKIENETLSIQKQKLKEQIECKINEAKLMEEKVSRKEAYVSELEDILKENGSLEDNKQRCLSRISNLVSQTKTLELQVDELYIQKGTLEERLSHETKERSSQVKGLVEEIDSLQKELLHVNTRKAKLELEMEMKSPETSECLIQIENRKEGFLERPSLQTGGISEKERINLYPLSSKRTKLEEQMQQTSHETQLSEIENQELQRKIFELETTFAERENELLSQQELCTQVESLNEKVGKQEISLKELYNEENHLQLELETLQNEKRQYQMQLEQEKKDFMLREAQLEKLNVQLTSKIGDQQKTMLELGEAMNKLKAESEKAQSKIIESKVSTHTLERKMEEMAGEIRKEFEAKYTILSRRIKVAEQLQIESKEWCLRNKEKNEEKSKEIKECIDKNEVGLMNIKDMSKTANDLLILLDRVALKFEECTEHFQNRFSKASCEVKFIQDWAMRKNKAFLHMKNEIDYLLSELNEKEAETLIYREKIWRLDKKVRELEKTIKKNEDGMLGLQEEKREAIRQLCVWIDYHRSRSDYIMRTLSEHSSCRKAS